MNLNSKKAKKELGDLIFNIALKNENAKEYLITNKNDNEYETESYKFNKLCFYRFKLLIIELYEKFGISYYDNMQDYIDDKEWIEEKADQAFQDWHDAKEKEVA